MADLTTIASAVASTLASTRLAGALRTVLREAPRARTTPPLAGGSSGSGGSRGSGGRGRGGSRKVQPSLAVLTEEDELLLPEDLKELLHESLTGLGYPLEASRIRDTSGMSRNHYRSLVKDGYIAWLYINTGSLEDGRNSLAWAWLGGEFARNGALGLFVLSDALHIALAFKTMERQWEDELKLRKVLFFDVEFSQELRQRSEPADRGRLVLTFIGANTFCAAATTLQNKSLAELGKPEKDAMVSILAALAANSNLTPEQFMKDLVDRTNWPARFKQQRSGGWTGNARRDARSLVDWAMERKENPDVSGYTILGSLLLELYGELGESDRAKIKALLCTYRLITDETALKSLDR